MANVAFKGVAKAYKTIVWQVVKVLCLFVVNLAAFLHCKARCFVAWPIDCLVISGAILDHIAAGASEQVLGDAADFAVARKGAVLICTSG